MLDVAIMTALSASFTRALTAPQLDLLDALFADDFSIWYGTTGQALDRQAALAFMHDYFPRLRLRFENIRLTATEQGWVQQHDVWSQGPFGAIAGMPACLVVTVRDGRLQRVEEYFDSRQTGGFDNTLISPRTDRSPPTMPELSSAG